MAAAGAAQAAIGGSDCHTAAAAGPAIDTLSPSMPTALPNDQPAEVHQLANGDHPLDKIWKVARLSSSWLRPHHSCMTEPTL